MQKLIRFLLIMILFSSLLQARYISVAVDGANYREGPGVNYKIFWDFDKGYPLRVLKYSNGWYRTVDYLGHVGWISSKMISNKKVVVVRRIRVNLRYGPGTNYKTIGKAYNGQLFYVLKRRGSWLRVRDLETGTISWIHNGLVWGSRY